MMVVKKLTMSSSQGLFVFLNKWWSSQVQNTIIMKLKGCCFGDSDQYMLMFEYIENKNLAKASWILDMDYV